MPQKRHNQNRTAIVYFGSTRQDYLDLVQADDYHQAYIEYVQKPLQEQLSSDKHKPDCHDSSRYTVHSQRERQLKGWQGEAEILPICRVKCCDCKAVFTVLPSFIPRYRRQDTDCLGKLLELNLGMGLTQRETAQIYEWVNPAAGWHPGWVWSLIQWLGDLLPVSLLMMRLGLTPPQHVLSDEKFATLNGEQIYLFLLSQEELIWYTEWMERTDEEAFNEVIGNGLDTIEEHAVSEALLPPEAAYTPLSATTDGWKPAQNTWQTLVPGINLIECNLHGRKRVDVTLDAYAQVHPNLSPADRRQIKDGFDNIFAAPSLGAFSQRLRRQMEQHQDEPILLKRLQILKEKRFLFTNHLKFETAPAFSSALDRSMRFLDEKLQTFGQFRAADCIDATLNAWAMVNNLRPFLPDAKKAGQSLAEFFGAQLHRLPWMEALNLCTVGALDKFIPAKN
jgi:hypothetical protein